ncbi:MAG: HAD-IIA family hydrolase [Armatimonadetes bacterium]|nr:HAD-IIA family hydrolase [Armatimonadota bacterium]
MPITLTDLRTCVLDMDGVIWTMDDPIPGAAEAISRLKSLGLSVGYLTNNSSKTRTDYVRKLAKFGIEAAEADVMTSAYATALLLAKQGSAQSRAYVIGEQGLRDELASVGIDIATKADEPNVTLVIVGWDRQFTYDKLAAAHGYIVRGGARFIATNRDATYPDAGGRTLPGGGSIVAAVATCAGVEPQTIGKPEPHALLLMLEPDGLRLDECLVIGDRLDTDIALGRRWGAPAAMVLTGISTLEEIDATPADLRPDVVAADLPALVDMLEA